MTTQFPRHTHRDHTLVFETLEPRRLFAAPYLGTFRGIATYPLDGITQHVKETITISPVTTTSALPPNPNTNEAGIIFARAFGPITFAGLSFHTVFDPSLDDAPLPTSHITDALPLGGTAYIGRFPSNAGTGIFQVFNNELTVDGTITTGIFAPASFDFDGTRVATASPAAAPPPATDTESLFKTLSLNQTFSLNPVLGTFVGHLTRASDKAVFKISAVVAKNKKRPSCHQHATHRSRRGNFHDSIRHSSYSHRCLHTPTRRRARRWNHHRPRNTHRQAHSAFDRGRRI